jgi:hypothetical protein
MPFKPEAAGVYASGLVERAPDGGGGGSGSLTARHVFVIYIDTWEDTGIRHPQIRRCEHLYVAYLCIRGDGYNCRDAYRW